MTQQMNCNLRHVITCVTEIMTQHASELSSVSLVVHLIRKLLDFGPYRPVPTIVRTERRLGTCIAATSTKLDSNSARLGVNPHIIPRAKILVLHRPGEYLRDITPVDLC